jgi:hypothetical protein
MDHVSQFAGSKVDATDFSLPTVVTAFGNGTNTITSTTFANLPTTSCIAAIVNSHPTANLLVLVTFGAWLSASANAVRICPAVSGAVTISAGIGGGGPIGWGEIPLTGSSPTEHHAASATYELPPGTSTFTMQSMRDSAAGTQKADYNTIRIAPLRYIL